MEREKIEMLLYITGSYPENKEGIASGAKILIDAMIENAGKEKILLLTTDTSVVSKSIDKNSTSEYRLIKNWKISKKNKLFIYKILDEFPITAIHMEYPGDLYGKTFFASFLPIIVRNYNKKTGKNITFNVRLHEFTQARFLRKIAIMPIVWKADRIYIPAQKDREILSKFAKNRVFSTVIGSNIKVVSNEIVSNKKITISYFGSIYPGKGIEHMLFIWKKIKEMDRDNKFLFKIIGEIDTDKENHFRDYHKQVWEWIKKYGLEDVINVTGYVTDEEVSYEIQHSQIATLFYEDGLTLRRGSFLAYLAHGIPIVTTMGDEEACKIFCGHDGITMAQNDEEIIDNILKFSIIQTKEKERIRKDNINLSKMFRWNNIAKNFLEDYGID